MLTRPIGLVLLVAVIWSFYYGIRRSMEETAKHKAQTNGAKALQAGNEQQA